ncbi:hypothetical protein Anas_09171 [Armadillidium nasatum]|uniref:Uncharacterized protein n=1 Tax=Armadillidium nasatum TaxID=96803 RepID=A0A5N5T8B1_9CRUS|nr:hypothetical protein Anas_09171 [Armadillidium nasatum]
MRSLYIITGIRVPEIFVPFVRYTFFNTVAFGIFSYSFMYSTFQPNLQRICSVKSLNHAKRCYKRKPTNCYFIEENISWKQMESRDGKGNLNGRQLVKELSNRW